MNTLTLLNQTQQIITNLTLVQISFQIETYHIQLKNLKNLIENINKLYLLKEYLIFSRLDTSDNPNKKCNFCSKNAYYSDIEYKYYCWFHRSQYENIDE